MSQNLDRDFLVTQDFFGQTIKNTQCPKNWNFGGKNSRDIGAAMIFLLFDSNNLFAKDNQLETIGSRSKTGEATKPLDLNNKVLLVDISLQDEALLSFPMDGSSLVRSGKRPPLDVEPGYTLTVLDLVITRPLSSQLSIASIHSIVSE